MSGLKTGVEDFIFWSETGSGFRESGGTPHQEFPGVPPPPPRGCMSATLSTCPLFRTL